MRYLVEHAVGEDGLLVEHLHGDALPGFGVLRELDLGEGAFPDGASHLVLAHPPQRPAAAATTPHHLRRAASLLSVAKESRTLCGVEPPLGRDRGAAQVANTTVDGKEISGKASLAPFLKVNWGEFLWAGSRWSFFLEPFPVYCLKKMVFFTGY